MMTDMHLWCMYIYINFSNDQSHMEAEWNMNYMIISILLYINQNGNNPITDSSDQQNITHYYNMPIKQTAIFHGCKVVIFR